VNDILQQRLVGALILVALGIIFWPIVFVQPEDQTALQQTSAVSTDLYSNAVGLSNDRDPEPNSASQTDRVGGAGITEAEVATEPASAAVISSSVPSGARRTANNTSLASDMPAQLTVDGDGIPVAWTLQVITVSSSDKAESLRKQLLDMQQNAYIVEVRSNGKKLYRVCIGPESERAGLDVLRPSINAQFKVNSIVARYMP